MPPLPRLFRELPVRGKLRTHARTRVSRGRSTRDREGNARGNCVGATSRVGAEKLDGQINFLSSLFSLLGAAPRVPTCARARARDRARSYQRRSSYHVSASRTSGFGYLRNPAAAARSWNPAFTPLGGAPPAEARREQGNRMRARHHCGLSLARCRPSFEKNLRHTGSRLAAYCGRRSDRSTGAPRLGHPRTETPESRLRRRRRRRRRVRRFRRKKR